MHKFSNALFLNEIWEIFQNSADYEKSMNYHRLESKEEEFLEIILEGICRISPFSTFFFFSFTSTQFLSPRIFHFAIYLYGCHCFGKLSIGERTHQFMNYLHFLKFLILDSDYCCWGLYYISLSVSFTPFFPSPGCMKGPYAA